MKSKYLFFKGNLTQIFRLLALSFPPPHLKLCLKILRDIFELVYINKQLIKEYLRHYQNRLFVTLWNTVLGFQLMNGSIAKQLGVPLDAKMVKNLVMKRAEEVSISINLKRQKKLL